MKRNNVDIYQPTRQSIASIAVLILKFIRVLVSAFWPIFLGLIITGQRGSDGEWWHFVGIGITGLSLVGSILAYFKYYFHVTEEEVHISKGIIKKTNLTIPFDRVQSVDFEQTIIHRLLNVVRVKIDTAGSAANELSIDALELPIAEKLRSTVIGYQKNQETVQTAELSDAPEEIVVEEEKKILSIDLPELIKIGISQNHLRTGGIILFFLFATWGELEQALGRQLDDQIGQIEDAASFEVTGYQWLVVGAFFLIVFLVISFVATLIMTVFRYYDMQVTRSPKGFKLTAGLLNRKEISAVHKKVQIVKWGYNYLQKLLGLHSLNILQATSEYKAMVPRFVLPGIDESKVDQFVGEYFPTRIRDDFKVYRIHKLIIYRWTLFFGLFPAIGVIALGYFMDRPVFYVLTAILPIVLIWIIY